MTIAARATADLGKLRGLQRLVSPQGMINACALDVLVYLANLLRERGRPFQHEDIVATKQALVSTLVPHASAVLLDAQYGLQSVAAGAVPGNVGLMVTIEDEDYDTISPATGRRVVFRENWSIRQIRMTGADAAKLLWFHRPDRNPETAAHQRATLTRIVAECAEYSLPLVVEPIWYPLPDEDPTTTAWRDRRAHGIVESVLEAAALGADVVKAEFPGYLDRAGGSADAAKACDEITRNTDVPWVTLSGGVPFEVFKEQVRISCQAGASGFLAGRAVWQDTVYATPGREQEALQRAAAKVAELNEIAAAYGRPFRPALPLSEAVERYPATWYESWHNVS